MRSSIGRMSLSKSEDEGSSPYMRANNGFIVKWIITLCYERSISGSSPDEATKTNVMKQFTDLVFETHPMGVGIIAREDFANGYGVTVVKTPYTYGGDKDLYELAVWKDGTIHYDNPVAKGDVVGYLREEDVTDAMHVVQLFKD